MPTKTPPKLRAYSHREVKAVIAEIERRCMAVTEHAPLNLWPADEARRLEDNMWEQANLLNAIIRRIFDIPQE